MESSRYRIVPAAVEHAAALPAIELAAATLFSEEDVPRRLREMAISVATHRRAAEEGRLWVAVLKEGGAVDDSAAAAGAPVGFAIVSIVDGCAHVIELDVHPAHARRGLGTRLLRAVAEWATGAGYPAVTLTTFRHLPWNAPFYERVGFRALGAAELTPGLRAQLDQEAANGLDPSKRIAMRLALVTPPAANPAAPFAPTTR